MILEDGNNIYLIFYFLNTVKKGYNFFYLSYPSIQLSTLKFHAHLKFNGILHIIKIVIIVYKLTNNNY